MVYWTVVTNVVNPMAFSLKIVVFRIRLTTFVTEVLARRFKLLRFDDVCNVGCPPVAQSGRHASTFMKVLVTPRPTPDREDSTPSDRVESSR